MILIEKVEEDTFELILPLVEEYQRFCGAEPDPEKNHRHFHQFVKNVKNGVQFIALNGKAEPMGFATLYFPFSSVSAEIFCLLNDIYVKKDSRKMGVGTALIRHCLKYARESGFTSIEWHTEKYDAIAKKLHEKLGAESKEWVVYKLSTAEIPELKETPTSV